MGITFKKIFSEIINKKNKKNGQREIKKFNITKEVDMLNLIYFMTEEQDLVYKQKEMLKLY